MKQIKMKQTCWLSMKDHVQECFPEEACGILGGIVDEVHEVYPVTNVLHSPVRYRMDPKEQYQTMMEIEAKEHSILGIYHSHINGPIGLSATDLSEATYVDSAYLVWSHHALDWSCKAFMIIEGRPVEIPVVILS